MLRNNTDVRRCSYFELGLPVVHQPNNTLFINYKKTFVRVQDVNNKHCYRKSNTLSKPDVLWVAALHLPLQLIQFY